MRGDSGHGGPWATSPFTPHFSASAWSWGAGSRKWLFTFINQSESESGPPAARRRGSRAGPGSPTPRLGLRRERGAGLPLFQMGHRCRLAGLSVSAEDGVAATAPAPPRTVQPRDSQVQGLGWGLAGAAISSPPINCPPPRSPWRLMGLLTCPVRQPSAHLRLHTSPPWKPHPRSGKPEPSPPGRSGERGRRGPPLDAGEAPAPRSCQTRP